MRVIEAEPVLENLEATHVKRLSLFIAALRFVEPGEVV